MSHYYNLLDRSRSLLSAFFKASLASGIAISTRSFREVDTKPGAQGMMASRLKWLTVTRAGSGILTIFLKRARFTKNCKFQGLAKIANLEVLPGLADSKIKPI